MSKGVLGTQQIASATTEDPQQKALKHLTRSTIAVNKSPTQLELEASTKNADIFTKDDQQKINDLRTRTPINTASYLLVGGKHLLGTVDPTNTIYKSAIGNG